MSRIPPVLTPGAIAERLLTTPQKVEAELEAGRLKGFKLGEDEWRVTEAALLEFMGISPSASDSQARTQEMTVAASTPDPTPQNFDIASLLARKEWKSIGSFDYKWPNGSEHHEEGYETRVKIGKKEIPIVIGFCNRESAGDKKRRRANVFMGHQPSLYPLVEFSGENSDVFETTGRMASVVKLPGGQHLRPGDPIPPEYIDLPLDNYRDIVRGPYAASSTAVVTDRKDYTLMAHHALIRARSKGLI